MSPRSKIENEQIRKVSRSKIIETALKLFGNNGFASTSIATIAQEAGISKGLMYNYFESKEQLLEAIIKDVIEKTEQLFGDVYAQPDPKVLFKNMVETTAQFLRTEREFNALLITLAIQKETHALIRNVAENKIAEMMPFLANVLDRLGFDGKTEVFIVGAAFDGMAIQYLTYENEEFLDNTCKALISKYVHNEN
ncbi:TetR/AcrR family transcriptional regulator [Marinilongibacter aquaticus]|uniref:TetR/AcrR family transcriptional regulator n=1 Tax=Marinilongibacter aquaticus TaxID=2975157 RepID=UPI0021BD2ABC|nr:TetR/AcrR family transcriptional regulator [Marinilongibacter aquaticus]UBM60355.1 TetR/AcrR family transcriptional regulator [Marinilongibacter aquaticus]